MLSRYRGKAGELNHLSGEITRFFEGKGFVVSKTEKASYTAVSVQTNGSAGSKIAEVHLISDANGSLVVTFESVEGSLLTRHSTLSTLLGGGFLMLKSLRSSEIMERLEREFWVRADEIMRSS
jgi:hypothetical protein